MSSASRWHLEDTGLDVIIQSETGKKRRFRTSSWSPPDILIERKSRGDSVRDRVTRERGFGGPKRGGGGVGVYLGEESAAGSLIWQRGGE